MAISHPCTDCSHACARAGSAFAFDSLLYHASWAGRDRHQWSTLYVRDAITPSWRQGLLDWYEGGTSNIERLPERWRPFDRAWVAEGSGDLNDPDLAQRHMWMHRFNRLGILDRFEVADAFRP